MESMPIVRAQVRIPAVSGVPEDTCINTWHFTMTATEEGDLAEVKADLVTFYEALDTYKSPLQLWTSTRIRFYDLSDPEPRVPFSESGLALTGASGTATAREVAICLSFRGELVSGTNPANRRGRIYFGPCSTNVIGTDGRITSSVVTAFAGAGGQLLLDSGGSSNYAWIVYSPTTGQGYPVVAGWVDNEIDIQRRRGMQATVRTAF
jgi:hypothetical protein